MDFTFKKISSTLNDEIDTLLVNNEQYILVSSELPEILTFIGLPNEALKFPRNKIIKGLLSDDGFNHGHKNEIGKKTLKKIFPHLGDPLAISYTEKNAFGIYLNDKASTGKPIYIYIRWDEKRKFNVVLSVYGRIATDAEKFIYIDDTKLRNKWDTKSYILKRFKTRLEDEVYKGIVETKTKLKRRN